MTTRREGPCRRGCVPPAWARYSLARSMTPSRIRAGTSRVIVSSAIPRRLRRGAAVTAPGAAARFGLRGGWTLQPLELPLLASNASGALQGVAASIPSTLSYLAHTSVSRLVARCHRPWMSRSPCVNRAIWQSVCHSPGPCGGACSCHIRVFEEDREPVDVDPAYVLGRCRQNVCEVRDHQRRLCEQ